MEQKNILCFGDSNTHGYNSRTGGRFGVKERWTRLLQKKLGDDYYIIEEGLSGRTTSFEDPVFEGLNGLSVIYPCMMSHEPLDLVMIMLGTNDTKDRFGANGFIIAKGMLHGEISQTCFWLHRRPSERAMHPPVWQEKWAKNVWSDPDILRRNTVPLQNVLDVIFLMPDRFRELRCIRMTGCI